MTLSNLSRSNRFILPFALFGLAMLAACGNGNGSVGSPNQNGFTNTTLSGTYVISMAGEDVNLGASTASYFAVVGTMTTDGKGNITGGTVDINDPDLGGTGVFTGQALSASTYSVSQDGRGTGALVTPEGTLTIDFVLTTSSHGLITRFDTGGSGSGTIDLQSTATQANLTALAFSVSGSDFSGGGLGEVGGFSLDVNGNITTGVSDFNDNGSSAGLVALPLTGSVVLTSGTNGTATFITSSAFPTLTFDVWVIDPTHLKLIETDTSGTSLSGDAYAQQTSFTAGQLVYTLGGADLSGNPFVAGGYATTDVNGNLTSGIEDYNDAGTTGSSSAVTGSCTTFAAGRCQLALTGFSNGAANNFTFAAYPSSGGVLLLEDDSLGFAEGAAYAQSATAFGAAGYGFNLSGANQSGIANGEVDDIAQFNATTSATNNMTGVLDENDVTKPISDVALTGTYTPDSPATGRGGISATTTGTFVGGLTLEYYVVDSSTVLFIEGDTTQVALGIFQAQSASSGAARAGRAISLPRPFVRAHALKKRAE